MPVYFCKKNVYLMVSGHMAGQSKNGKWNIPNWIIILGKLGNTLIRI